jgi:hypothetical protein
LNQDFNRATPEYKSGALLCELLALQKVDKNKMEVDVLY